MKKTLKTSALAVAFCTALAFAWGEDPASWSSWGSPSPAQPAAQETPASAAEPAAQPVQEAPAVAAEPAAKPVKETPAPAAAAEPATQKAEKTPVVEEPAKETAKEAAASEYAPSEYEKKDTELAEESYGDKVKFGRKPPEPEAEAEPEVEEVAVLPTPMAPVHREEAAEIRVIYEEEGSYHHLGIRMGLGFSAMRQHKALQSPDFIGYAIILNPSCAASAGLVYEYAISGDFTVGIEALYSYYSAHGEFSVRNKDEFDFGDLNVAGVSLHVLELPLLARYNNGRVYSEIGPQIGFNLYSQMYKNSDLKKPYIKNVAFGLAAGTGVVINDYILLGVRAHFGFIEYADNSNGKPWSVQAGVTKFFF